METETTVETYAIERTSMVYRCKQRADTVTVWISGIEIFLDAVQIHAPGI